MLKISFFWLFDALKKKGFLAGKKTKKLFPLQPFFGKIPKIFS